MTSYSSATTALQQFPTEKYLDRTWCAARFRPRAADAHKGSFGTLAVIGGHAGMEGAVLVAARAALHAGCGKVFAAMASDHAPAFDPLQPELMLRSPTALLAGRGELGIGVWAIGCGMGRDDRARELTGQALSASALQPVVLDADALYWLAQDRQLLSGRQHDTILTPHPLEAARLLGVDVKDIQADRVGAACTIARTYSAVTVLKGAGTVVATPAGEWHINTSGNPGLASAGTGDVLTGVIAALLAQGMTAEDAACCGAWLHGAAADWLVERGCGPVGMTASDVVLAVRSVLNGLAAG